MSSKVKLAVMFIGELRTFQETSKGLYEMFRNAAQELRFVYLPPNPLDPEFDFGVDYDKINYPSKTADKKKAIRDQWTGLTRARDWCERLDSSWWVCRCRPDLKVIKPMENLRELQSNRLYFPKHNNWGGLNDRFWFGPQPLMSQSFEYPFYIAKWLKRPLNLERCLGRFIALDRKIPIGRTNAVLSPLRENGKIDPLVYREDRGDIKP